MPARITDVQSRLFAQLNETICWGDCIEGAKFFPYVAPHCPDLTLVTRKEMVRLFSRLGMPVIAFEEANPIALANAPRYLHECLPPGVRIPRGDQMALPELWADESVPFAPDTSLFQVGLCWHGSGGGRSKIGGDDDPRCIPVEMLLPLLAVPNVQFTALHLADHARKLQDLPEAREIQSLTDFGVWDFAGTAGVMRKLDLVITIDTSVAHLAGTLGAQTWLMLHSMFDHGRWSCVPANYPTVRQFRQDTPGDWRPVVEQVKAELTARVSQ